MLPEQLLSYRRFMTAAWIQTLLSGALELLTQTLAFTHRRRRRRRRRTLPEDEEVNKIPVDSGIATLNITVSGSQQDGRSDYITVTGD